jgi:hypothetical protein
MKETKEEGKKEGWKLKKGGGEEGTEGKKEAKLWFGFQWLSNLCRNTQRLFPFF